MTAGTKDGEAGRWEREDGKREDRKMGTGRGAKKNTILGYLGMPRGGASLRADLVTW